MNDRQFTCFTVERHQTIAHIVLSRPEKRNSMISAFWQELPVLLTELDRQGDVRVIVLSSTGPHFSAGMDLQVFNKTQDEDGQQSDTATVLTNAQRSLKFQDVLKQLQQAFTSLETCRIPVLAAIQGGCIGAGLDMITACDCRYATTDAYFTIQETNLAMTADVGTFPRLCHLLPDGLVRELAYTGRALSADEALHQGLVNACFPDQEAMLEHVMGVAERIAGQAPIAVHGCKRLMVYARDHRVSDTLDYVGLWNASMLSQQEIVEAMQAQRSGRSGQFAPLPSRPSGEDDIEIDIT